MYGEYDDLASFDGGYTPQAAFRPGLDTLADGDYDFTITDARLDRAKDGQRILNVGLRTHTGLAVERTYWLTSQENMNRLGADLLVLGFPADKWGAGGSTLAVELPRAVAALPGVKFRASKKARVAAKDGKTYHDLYVHGRVSGQPMPAAPAPLAPGAGRGGGAGAGAGVTETEAIPF